MATRRTGKEVEATEAEPEINDLNSLFGIDETATPESIEQLDTLFADVGGVITIQGSPYTVLDKEKLVEVPFTIIDTRFYESKQFGNDVVAVRLLTEEPINGERLFVINDGSAGICRQLKGIVKKAGRRGGFACPKGLRASRYEYQRTEIDGVTPMGKPIEATTYYIA